AGSIRSGAISSHPLRKTLYNSDMFWAYILRCADGSYYTGHTEDLENRVAEHQHGRFPGYTHDRRPVELVWSQDFATREEALSAELRIKPWSRAKKEALISGNWNLLSYFAVPPKERPRRASASLALPLDFARDERIRGRWIRPPL